VKNHFLNIYSYLDNPRGFPGRFNYVPTLVGLSGYTTCQYALNGKVLTIVFVANAIGVTGTAPSISLPWTGVTSMDVTVYKKHILSIAALSGLKLTSGDVDGSGLPINTTDMTLILRKRLQSEWEWSLFSSR